MPLAALDAALAEADAGAFVHAGPPGDPTIHSLAGAPLPCEAAVVYTDSGVTVVPTRDLPAHVTPDERVTVRDPDPTPARALPEVVAEADVDAVLAPASVPHDAALYLERAGVDLASTDAHERARAVKTDDELAAIGAAQTAAEAGMAAAARLLATARQDDAGHLVDDAGDVTAERVRRAANAAVASEGGNPAGTTVVRADGHVDAAETVPIRLAPRVRGYHGLLARTFVADAAGGWERRATLACEYAVEMGVDFVDPGETTAEAVAGEVTAELGSYGFPPTAASGAVFGVGLDARERPTGSDVLEPGAVVALAPELDDEAPVWVADLAVVGEDGAERLGAFPRSVVPKESY